MRTRRNALGLAAVLITTAMAAIPVAAQAQDAYVITYIETAPKSAKAARGLIEDYRDAAMKAQGVTQFDALQRIGSPGHFAIVESWTNAKAQEAFAGTAAAKEFRKSLDPLLTSAYDERPHSALSVGAKSKTAGAVYAVTHVDIIPTKKDEGVAATKALGDKSRTAVDALRFDALTQISRPNHMTIVESWKSKSAKEKFTSEPHLVSYRKNLTPMSGSLYDERLYTLIK